MIKKQQSDQKQPHSSIRRRQDKLVHSVFVNVYGLRDSSLCNKVCNPVGFGIHHSALQINNKEYAFGGDSASSDSGIYKTRPR